jgi:hydrogenase-4 component F
MFTHLALVFMAGIYMPQALVKGFENVARLLG